MESRTKRNTTEKDYRERKRVKVKATVKESNNLNTQLSQLLKEINELKDPNDNTYLVSTLFIDKPSKKHYADYYKVIKQPIALSDIKNKLSQYQSFDQFKADIDLMVSNAQAYNESDSQVYNDALHIQKYVHSWQPKREKTVLKLPGEAFNSKGIKAIKLKAVNKHKPSSNMMALMESIQKKEHKRVIEIFENDTQLDPNELVETEMFGDKFTWAPLHAAAYYGHVKLMPHLMERKGDIELHDTWHSATPLGWAAFGDRDKMVKLLVQRYHADVKAKNRHGQVPYDVVSDQKDQRWQGLFHSPTQIHIHKPIQQKKGIEPPPITSSSSSLAAAPATVKSIPITTTINKNHNNNNNNTLKLLPASTTPIAPALIQHKVLATANTDLGSTQKKRRGRPPKSETDAQDIRPTERIDITTFDPVAFEIELFNAIRTHSDNTNRHYSELFEDLPDRIEYPDYYTMIHDPRSLSQIALNMTHRHYLNLQQWMMDMHLVFDNALKYNEPGSRIFRDAKLLKRLLYRLKERVLARWLVPVSQEEEVMALDLTCRVFDASLLSEDKRKGSKRISSKSRTQSIEPQELLMSQASIQPPLMLQPTSILPASIPPPVLLDPTTLLQNNPMMMTAMMNSPDIMNLAAAADPSMFASIKYATPLSTESYKLIKEQGRCLDSLQFSSNNNTFHLSIDCHLLSHSINVPSHINTLLITPQLPNHERNRFAIMVFHNNTKLDPNNESTWTSPLVRGMNVIKVSVTVNLTQPDANSPDFKSQLYHVFIQQTW
ncbi:Bromodomain-containing protein [Backusella circina FSU 941]|nr:Bromodomain-containing protein [Backusella circina FSU 941]